MYTQSIIQHIIYKYTRGEGFAICITISIERRGTFGGGPACIYIEQRSARIMTIAHKPAPAKYDDDDAMTIIIVIVYVT